MKETEIQSAILAWLKSRGIWHRRLPLGAVKHGGVRKKNPMKGFPDVFGVLKPIGRMFAIEVKTPTGKLSEVQVKVRQELEAEGVVYVLARSVEDVERELGA